MAESEQKNQEAQGRTEAGEIDAGDAIVSWETWEYPPYDRSVRWYVIAAVIGAALLVYAIVTQNYLFAIIILMMGVILLMSSLRRPDRINVHITTLGVVIGNEFHPYKEVKDFSIIYEPPEVKLLYVDFQPKWRPMAAVPLEDMNPNVVRDALLPYAFENIEREQEGLTDLVRRLYKL